jgi:glycosyltransferase involved in cell wall biosynthesis
VKVLLWHVHAAWATAFVHGPHETVVPLTGDRGPWGRGRPATYAWPLRAREVPVTELADEHVDVVVLQRVEELQLVRRWLGRDAGHDLPAVYVEHNAPRGDAVHSRHPMAEQSSIPVVHVTAFNALMWDNGRAPVRVVEHGIPDPGERWTGALPRVAAVVNEPMRRGRVTGTDLLPWLARTAPVDLFGIGTDDLADGVTLPGVHGQGDLPQDAMLTELAQRRVYLHPCRWTSLGLALLEAMHLGMPIVAVAGTAAPEALADTGAVVSSDLDRLAAGLRLFLHDADAAADAGRLARKAALQRFGLDRFVADWRSLLEEVT